MLVHITLPIAALSFGIRGREVSWWGPCKAEFVDTSPDDDYPLRGDVTFLNRFPSELGILPREDGKLDQTLHAAGLDQQIVEWRKDGYDQEDVLLLRYYKTTKEYPEFLGLSVALSKHKMERFTQIFHHHFPKPEVDLRIGCSFHGFREFSLRCRIANEG